MRQLHPAWLVGSHSRPLAGREAIDQALGNYARAIRFVHDQTVKRINDGEPLYQIRQEVRLPPDLASQPYLQPVYGTVEWAVNGVFRQYTGWYDFDPAHLNGGGSDAILQRARKAAAEGQLQLALELAEVVIGAHNDAAAHRLRAELLERLAAQTANGVARNIYLEAATAERKAIQ